MARICIWRRGYRLLRVHQLVLFLAVCRSFQAFFYRVSLMLLQNFRASITQWNRVSQTNWIMYLWSSKFLSTSSPVPEAGQLKRQWSKTMSWSLDSVFGLLCGQGLWNSISVNFISYWYWVGQKVCSGFSIRHGKIQTNFFGQPNIMERPFPAWCFLISCHFCPTCQTLFSKYLFVDYVLSPAKCKREMIFFFLPWRTPGLVDLEN